MVREGGARRGTQGARLRHRETGCRGEPAREGNRPTKGRTRPDRQRPQSCEGSACRRDSRPRGPTEGNGTRTDGNRQGLKGNRIQNQPDRGAGRGNGGAEEEGDEAAKIDGEGGGREKARTEGGRPRRGG